MTRTIKFRAWCFEHKRMHYAVDLIDGQFTTDDHDGSDDGLHKYAVMQSTGLLDKSGKEIYEGDIVKDDLSVGEVRSGEFEYSDGEYISDQNGWHITNRGVRHYTDDEDVKRSDSLTSRDCKYLEIIGNIYQNPELLNKHE